MGANVLAAPRRLLHDDHPATPELFGQDQLERHAVVLAGLYRLAPDPSHGRPLLPRLDDSARSDSTTRTASCRRPSRRTRRRLGPKTGCATTITSCRIRFARSARICRASTTCELPKLADGPFAGYPRVYAFARELITHTAGRLDLQTLVDFAAAYQRVAPLTIGEIWAIPIMLRLGARRRVAPARRRRRRGAPQPRSRARVGRAARHRRPRAGTRHRRDVARRSRRRRPPVGRIRRRAAALAARSAVLRRARLAWRCSARSKRRTIRPTRCCASSISARPPDSSPSATSSRRMRLLSSIDWPLFFERVSLVEQILREDPAGAYAKMDFATRDRYRHSVEQLAQRRQGGRDSASRDAPSSWQPRRSGDDPASDRTPSRRLLPDLARPLPARARSSAIRRRCAIDSSRFFYGHPVIGYLGTDRRRHGARRSPASSPTPRRHGGVTARLWLTALIVAAAGQRARDQPDQPRRHVAGHAAAAAEARRCAPASRRPTARWSSCRPSSIPKRG